tara:strand:+ start:2108 stop:2920 length:813 start_codon:yes stop_codon:yes gene_type:complete
MILTTEQSNELFNNGITRYKNLLSLDEINLVKKIIKSHSGVKTNKDTFFPTSLKSYLIKFIKADFIKIKQGLIFKNLSKKKKLKEISDYFFKEKSYLKMIDGYCSPISNKNFLEWHCDQSYSNKTEVEKILHPKNRHLKFFIYLTAVKSDNGCMCYIPKSHRIAYALKMGIIEKKIEYQKFQYLKDFRSLVSMKNNHSYINNFLKDKNIVDNFLENTKFIENNSDTKQYDYDMEPGDAIIFDENGIHKGSRILENERIVLRFFFSTKNQN